MNKKIILFIIFFIIALLFIIDSIQIQNNGLYIDFVPQISKLSFTNIWFDVMLFIFGIIAYFAVIYREE